MGMRHQGFSTRATWTGMIGLPKPEELRKTLIDEVAQSIDIRLNRCQNLIHLRVHTYRLKTITFWGYHHAGPVTAFHVARSASVVSL